LSVVVATQLTVQMIRLMLKHASAEARKPLLSFLFVGRVVATSPTIFWTLNIEVLFGMVDREVPFFRGVVLAGRNEMRVDDDPV
jgi:hypothetical protein